jgi:hypothetical protein
MTPSEVQQLLLNRLGLRVGPEMAAYVLRACNAAAPAPTIPVIATEARTGVATRQDVAADLPESASSMIH